ncbi:hypothetical protein ASPBRDRAFT_279557 [Aspergillus brasiliensis CBS 101740]|uniref:Uncharacterized protein n=1 Tax=Aspergillus brasiliensis (strain CBS 101740 / IMI 381727 / IBT 21946) TaxID=767769 RepID=A0A1L9UCS9_ASPBC|nr:hypothetical protein ASPBRDRAFT_279557 [Aspergillus brasiliensis CBS 101740]
MVEALIGHDSFGRSGRRCLLTPSLSCDSLCFMYAQLAALGSVKTFCSISVYLSYGRGFACCFLDVDAKASDLHLGPMFVRGRPEKKKKKKGWERAIWEYRNDWFVHGFWDLAMEIDDGFGSCIGAGRGTGGLPLFMYWEFIRSVVCEYSLFLLHFFHFGVTRSPLWI